MQTTFNWYTTPFFIKPDANFNDAVEQFDDICIQVSKDYNEVLGKTFPKDLDTRWLYSESCDDIRDVASILNQYVDVSKTPHVYVLDYSVIRGQVVGGWCHKLVFNPQSDPIIESRTFSSLLFF